MRPAASAIRGSGAAAARWGYRPGRPSGPPSNRWSPAHHRPPAGLPDPRAPELHPPDLARAPTNPGDLPRRSAPPLVRIAAKPTDNPAAPEAVAEPPAAWSAHAGVNGPPPGDCPASEAPPAGSHRPTGAADASAQSAPGVVGIPRHADRRAPAEGHRAGPIQATTAAKSALPLSLPRLQEQGSDQRCPDHRPVAAELVGHKTQADGTELLRGVENASTSGNPRAPAQPPPAGRLVVAESPAATPPDRDRRRDQWRSQQTTGSQTAATPPALVHRPAATWPKANECCGHQGSARGPSERTPRPHRAHRIPGAPRRG